MYIKSKYNVHTCKWLRMIWCHTTVFFFRVEWICRWWIVWFANLSCCATVGTPSILGTKTVAVGWVTWKRVLFIISSNLIHVLSQTYSYTSYHPIAFYSPYLQYIRTFSSAPNHTEAWWPSRPGSEPLGRVAVVPAAFSASVLDLCRISGTGWGCRWPDDSWPIPWFGCNWFNWIYNVSCYRIYINGYDIKWVLHYVPMINKWVLCS